MACGLVLALGLVGLSTTTAVAATRGSAQHTRAHAKAVRYYRKEIRKYRRETWYWQRVMGVRRSRAVARSLAGTSSLERLRHLRHVWRRREHVAHRHALHPPHERGWLCIHRYEGSWTDAGAPYYGGLQMDLGFQRTYGGWLLRTKGTADHWTPLEQIWTAVRAQRSRGFYPWPNTARVCGLL